MPEYGENDAKPLIGQLFSGAMGPEEAIERLRTRLLDLTARNPLLNFKHPKNKCIQFIDSPFIDLVFNRLYEETKQVSVNYIPEPSPLEYQGKKPDVKEYASEIGIDISTEFEPFNYDIRGHQLNGLQALHYPEELERLLGKISRDSKTAIEETGSNVLFMVFGFLQFYESEDSDRPLLSPLLSIPVSLNKGKVDPQTGTYQYTVGHNGEDLAENQTLREKLSKDFRLTLPEFLEEESPEDYFEKVEEIISKKRRWKVRRQLTLGLLSFGKLAIWDGLNTKKNPHLAKHKLIKSIFAGNGGNSGLSFSEDYDVDKHPRGDLQFIFDADSSQHSAIIDVLAGKNIVINGPPGTGKSQTITNIIANAVSNGKKVLFVSEKMAALEVVRRRLTMAGLGNFCLELHSHKTQKKQLLDDIDARIKSRFPAPSQLDEKLATLKKQKEKLSRYAQLMGSVVGNKIGLTINEIFWATEKNRQELESFLSLISHIEYSNAHTWSHDDWNEFFSSLEDISSLFVEIKTYDKNHPWWGFVPNPLFPNELQRISLLIENALGKIGTSIASTNELSNSVQIPLNEDLKYYENFYDELNILEDIQLSEDLLPKLFNFEDENFNINTLKIKIAEFVKALNRLIDMDSSIAEMQEGMDRICFANLLEIEDTCLFENPINLDKKIINLNSDLSVIIKNLDVFRFHVASNKFDISKIPELNWLELNKSFDVIKDLDILKLNCQEVFSTLDSFRSVLIATKEANDKLSVFKDNNFLNYDGTSASINRIANKNIFNPLIINEIPTELKIEDLKIHSRNPHASKSLRSLDLLVNKTKSEISEVNNSLFELKRIAQEVHQDFPLSYAGIQELVSLSNIASSAPLDLMQLRNNSFSTSKAKSLLIDLEKTIQSYSILKEDIDRKFFTDALPEAKLIKDAIIKLRSKDGFFAFFDSDWRSAKSLHVGLSKSNASLNSKNRAEELTKLVKYLEFDFENFKNPDYINIFGELFQGVKTNIEDIRRLIQWYEVVGAEIVKCPWISRNIDISKLNESKIKFILTSKSSIELHVNIVVNKVKSFKEVSSPEFSALSNFLNRNLEIMIRDLKEEINGIENVVKEFRALCNSEISPAHAYELILIKKLISPFSKEIEQVNNFNNEFNNILPVNLKFLKLTTQNGIHKDCEYYLTKTEELYSSISLIGSFNGHAVTLEKSRDLFVHSQNFKMSLASLGLEIVEINFENWTEFESQIERFINNWASTLNFAIKFLPNYKTISDLILLISKCREFNTELQKLNNSKFVTETLEDIYSGIDTPLELLVQTFEWGLEVHKLSIPTRLKRILLSSSAKVELNNFRLLLAQIVESANEAKIHVEELSQFGEFSWDEWLCIKNNQKVTLRDVETRLLICKENLVGVLPWAKYIASRSNIATLGLTDFLNALESKQIPPEFLSKAFEFSAYQSIGKRIYSDYPELLNFNARNHERVREEFQRLDSEIIKLNGKSFANLIQKSTEVPHGSAGVRVGDYTELNLLKHEINKQRKHIPIRKLLSRAGNALLELKPIFMMGPMSVAQYLEGDNLSFDLIVMDEASQLRPEEAIGAIAKAKQLVVVGDPKQLPPTNFFDKLTESPDDENEDDVPAVLTGMESILDICQLLFTPTRSLRWHYRSQHESLIAFSNFHFYKNLIVFPSPFSKSPELGVKYRYLPKGVYKDRQNFPEAQAVVDAVINHMIKSPHESLGVVTLNQTQRELIEELLEQKFKVFSETSSFRANWDKEGWPFFVKNLENVQGDERDVIYISTTFGKAPGTSKPKQNFGPISRPDGWRRLNVLFTRSRKRVELFTSMSAEDIVVDEKTPLGTKALHDYLDFARRGILVATDEGIREPDSDFEVAVANVIRNWGYEVRPQLGVAGFFIDLVVKNPRRPGEYLAAIECDGATYHSGCSVRDRDRIRQEILESLGWKNKICRIWSTDWFYNPLESIDKLKSFLDSCQRKADAELGDSAFEVDHYVEIDVQPQSTSILSNPSDTSSGVAQVDFADDVFVEVGDRVTFVSSQSPNERFTVTITDALSNPNLNFVNEKTPLAVAILGLCVGEIGELRVSSTKGIHTNELKILKIER
jgi:hypothetical protein